MPESKEKVNRNPELSEWSLRWTRFQEWLEVRRGKRDRLTPPRRLLDEAGIGGGDYDQVGKMLFDEFRKLCGVAPDDAILDIGCGYGRIAKPFTRFLDPPKGRYVGLNIFRRQSSGARRHSRYPIPISTSNSSTSATSITIVTAKSWTRKSDFPTRTARSTSFF